MLPLIIGILIGASLTRNKYVFYVLISILIFNMLFSALASKINKVKESTDKKMAARNEVVKSINSVIDVTEYGNSVGGRMFDKFYSNYVFLFNLGLVLILIFLLIYQQWLWSAVTYLGLHTFIVLNQILRKVNHLDNSDYVKKPVVKKGIPIGSKIL
jgi:hypothetical protein